MKQISHNGLTIVMSKTMKTDAKDILQKLQAETSENGCRFTQQECQTEVQRLLSLADTIMSDETVFQYLPLTKQNKFPVDANILIASSKIAYGHKYEGYVKKETLQLRLVPAYTDDIRWILDEREPDTKILKLGLFDNNSSMPPVYDENGTPSKPEVARATYLKDDEIIPGHVYQEKNGAKYLVITGMPLSVTYWKHEKGQTPDRNDRSCQVPFDPRYAHYYIRWTDAMEKALGATGTASWNDLAKFMTGKNKYGTWFESVSRRENPRKFISEVCAVIDPSKTVQEDISKDNCPAQYGSYYADYRYRLHPDADFFSRVRHTNEYWRTIISGEED